MVEQKQPESGAKWIGKTFLQLLAVLIALVVMTNFLELLTQAKCPDGSVKQAGRDGKGYCPPER